MITIGLTTWREHGSLVHEGQERKLTLPEYAQFLPCVELDTPFYGIPRESSFKKWAQETPPDFQFIIKANQVMTRHREPAAVGATDEAEVFTHFKQSSAPLVAAGKLKTILLQFPPFFGVNQENVRYLRRVRHYLGDLPAAVEFRNQAWYQQAYRQQMLGLLRQLNFSHVIVDEPQTPTGSTPYFPVATNPLALLRLHGRNFAGWANQGKDWRRKRTLWRYNDNELKNFAYDIRRLTGEAQEVCVIFNNNSGGDAADNALRLQELLGLEFKGLAPQQMDLF